MTSVILQGLGAASRLVTQAYGPPAPHPKTVRWYPAVVTRPRSRRVRRGH